MKLLLFDIDGTILMTHRLGRRVMEGSLSAFFGRPIKTEGVAFAGRTDGQIVSDALRSSGISESEIAHKLPGALEAFSEAMAEVITKDNVTLLPGMQPLIDGLSAHPHIVLGLVTGNLERTAYLKLDAVGMAGHFPFGAFGSDAFDRNELPAIAVRRAREATGRQFTGSDVIIIGDTEHDVHCSRTIGALCVAVCTGHYSRQELSKHEPDVIFDDLTDYERFLEAVMVAA